MSRVPATQLLSDEVEDAIDFCLRYSRIAIADCVNTLDGAAAEFVKLHRSVHEMFARAEKALGGSALNTGDVEEMRLHYIEACQAMHGLREDLGLAREKLEEQFDEPAQQRAQQRAARQKAPKVESPGASDVAAE